MDGSSWSPWASGAAPRDRSVRKGSARKPRAVSARSAPPTTSSPGSDSACADEPFPDSPCADEPFPDSPCADESCAEARFASNSGVSPTESTDGSV